jgi:hypothetical protein
MDTETPAASVRSTRPNPVLLVLLGLAAVALLVMRLGGSAGPAAPASTPPGTAVASPDAAIDPALLDVRLEALAEEPPAPGGSERNPFRFQPRAAPPQASVPAPVPQEEIAGGPGAVGPLPSSRPAQPPPPPITVRFIGLVDRGDGSRVAVFVDCSVGRRTAHAQEGGIVDGRYRLVKVGAQSVVIEHLDGRGRTTLALTGQDCVGK